MCMFMYIYRVFLDGVDVRSLDLEWLRSRFGYVSQVHICTDGLYTKGTRARTHRELIREWLWEPKGSSLEYI